MAEASDALWWPALDEITLPPNMRWFTEGGSRLFKSDQNGRSTCHLETLDGVNRFSIDMTDNATVASAKGALELAVRDFTKILTAGPAPMEPITFPPRT